jgi:meiotically up-regulated gene 157 (Mug157) protein
MPFITRRPHPHERRFVSTAVDEAIEDVRAAIAEEELAWMFENCFPNTLDTTVDMQDVDGAPDAFVITGDIDAMWLRDSTAQIWPYLRFVNRDDRIKRLFRGAIRRQAACVTLDPYANAFYQDARLGEMQHDKTRVIPYADAIGDGAAADRCSAFAAGVQEAIENHGVVTHPSGRDVYAYEVDEFGGRVFMDDANVPSLLSLPYL